MSLFAALALIVLWQVVSRYALASPSSASEELARMCLMWLGLLGACYAHFDQHHIAIKLAPQLAPDTRETISIVCCQVFALILLLGGSKLCHATFTLSQTSPVLGLPMGLVYLVLPLSGLLMGLANYWHLQERKWTS